MSWMANEWKDDLTPRALRKVEELEGQLERFKKDVQQKQFRLENLEQALEVHKRKNGAQSSLEKELQSKEMMISQLREQIAKLKQASEAQAIKMGSMERELKQSPHSADKESLLQAQIEQLKVQLDKAALAVVCGSQGSGDLMAKLAAMQAEKRQAEESRDEALRQVQKLKLNVLGDEPMVSLEHSEDPSFGGHTAVLVDIFGNESRARNPSKEKPRPADFFGGFSSTSTTSSTVSVPLADESQFENLQKSLDKLRKENETLKNGNVNRDLTIQAKEREVATCVGKLREAQAEIDTNARALVDLERQQEQQKDQMAKIKMKDQAEENELRAELHRFTQKNLQLEKDHKEMSRRVEAAESAMHASADAAQNVQKTLQSLKFEKDRLALDLDRKQAENLSLSKTEKEAKYKLEMCEQRFGSAQHELEESKKKTKEVLKEQQNLQAQVESLRRETEVAKEAKKIAERKGEGFESKEQSFVKENANLQVELKKVCGLADERNREVRDLIDQLSRKEQEMEKGNQRLQMGVNEVGELKAKNKTLLESNEDLEKGMLEIKEKLSTSVEELKQLKTESQRNEEHFNERMTALQTDLFDAKQAAKAHDMELLDMGQKVYDAKLTAEQAEKALKEKSEFMHNAEEQVRLLTEQLSVVQTEFDVAAKEITTMADEINKMKGDKEEMLASITKAQENERSVLDARDETRKDLEREKENGQEMSETLDKVSKNLANVTSQLDSKVSEYDLMQDNFRQLEKEAEESRLKFDEVVKQSELKMENQQRDLEANKERVRAAEAEVDDLKSKCEGYSLSLDQTKDSLKAKDEAEVAFEENCNKLQTKLTSAQEEIDSTTKSLTACKEQLSVMESKMAALHEEKVTMETHLQQEVDAHKSQLELVQMDLEDKDAMIQDLESREGNLSVLNNTLKETQEKAHKECSEAQEKMTTVSRQLEEMEQQLDEATKALTQEKDGALVMTSKLKAQLEEAMNDRQKTEEEMKELERRGEEMDQLRRQVEEYAQEMKVMRTNATEQEKALKAELDCVQSSGIKVEEERSTLGEEGVRLRQELEEVNKRLKEVDEGHVLMEKEVKAKMVEEEGVREKMDVELKEVVAKLDAKEEEFSGMETKMNELVLQKEQTASDCCELREKLCVVVQREEALEKRMTEIDEERVRLEEELSSARKEGDLREGKAQEVMNEMQTSLKNYQKSLEDVEQDSGKLSAALSEKSTVLAEVEEQLSQAKVQLQQADQSGHDATEKLAGLVAELAEEQKDKGVLIEKLTHAEKEVERLGIDLVAIKEAGNEATADMHKKLEMAEEEKASLFAEQEKLLDEMVNSQQDATAGEDTHALLSAQFEQLKQQQKKTDDEILPLKDSLKMSEDQLQEISVERDELKSLLVVREQELMQKEQVTSGCISGLREQLMQQSETLLTLEGEQESLQTELQGKETEVRDLKIVSLQLKEDLDQSQATVLAKAEDISVMMVTVEELKTEKISLGEELEKVHTELNEAVLQIERETLASEGLIDEMRKSLADLKEDQAKKTVELNEALNNMEEKRMMEEDSEKRIYILQENDSQMRQTLEEMKKKIGEMEEKTTHVQSEKDLLASKLEVAEDEMIMMQKALDELQEKLNQLMADTEAKRTSFAEEEEERHREVEALSSTLFKAEELNASLQENVDILNESKRKLEDIAQQQNDTVERLQERATLAETECNEAQVEINRLRDEILENEEKLKGTNIEKHVVQEQLKNLETNLEQAEQERSDIKMTLNETGERLQSSEVVNAELRAHVLALEEDSTVKDQRLLQLQEELKSALVKVQNREEEVGALEGKVEALKKELSEAEDGLMSSQSGMMGKMHDQEKEVNALLEKLDLVENDLRGSKAESERLEEEAEEMKIQVEDREEVLRTEREKFAEQRNWGMDKIQALNDSLLSKEQEITTLSDSLEKEQQEGEERLENERKKLQENEKMIEEMERKLSEIQQLKNEQQHELRQKEEAIESLEAALKVVEEKMQQAESREEEIRAEGRADAEQEGQREKALYVEIEQLKANEEDMERKLCMLEQQKQVMEDELAAAVASEVELKAKHVEEIQSAEEMHESKISSLVDEKDHAVGVLRDEKDNLSRDVESVRSELRGMQDKISIEKTESEAEQARLQCLLEELTNKESAYTDVIAEMESKAQVSAEEIACLKETLIETEGRLKQMEVNESVLTEERETAEQQNTQLLEQVVAAQEAIDEMVQEMVKSGHAVQASQKTVSSLEASKEEAVKQLSQHEAEISGYRESIEEMEMRLEAQEEKIRKLNDALEEAQLELESQTLRATGFEQRVDEVQHLKKAVEDELRLSEEKMEEIEMDLERIRSVKDGLQQESESEKERLSEEADVKSRLCGELTLKCDRFEEQNDCLKEQVNTMMIRNAETDEERRVLIREREEVEEMLNQQKQELVEALQGERTRVDELYTVSEKHAKAVADVEEERENIMKLHKDQEAVVLNLEEEIRASATEKADLLKGKEEAEKSKEAIEKRLSEVQEERERASDEWRRTVEDQQERFEEIKKNLMCSQELKEEELKEERRLKEDIAKEFTEEKTQLLSQLSVLEREKESLELERIAQTKEWDERTTALNDRLAEVSSRDNGLRSRFEAELAESAVKLTHALAAKDHATERVGDLERELEKLQRYLDDMENQSLVMEANVQELRGSLEDVQREKQDLTTLVEQQTQHLQEKEAEISQQVEDAAAFRLQNEEKSGVIRAVSQENLKVKDEITVLKDHVEVIVQDAKQLREEISCLQAEKAVLEEEVNEGEKRLKESEGGAALLKEEIQTMCIDLKDKEMTLNAQVEQCAKNADLLEVVMREKEDVEAELKGLKVESSQKDEDRIVECSEKAELEQRLEAMVDEIAQQKEQVQDLNEQIRLLRKDLAAAEREIKKAEEENETQMREAKRDIVHHQEQADTWKERYLTEEESKSKERDELREELAAVEEAKAEAERELKGVAEQLQLSQRQVNALEDTLDCLKKAQIESRAELVKLREKDSASEKKRCALEESLEATQAEMAALNAEKGEVNEKMGEAHKGMEALRVESADLQKRLMEATQAGDELKTLLQSEKSQNSDALNQMLMLEDKNASLLAQLTDAGREREKMGGALERSEAILEEAAAKAIVLEADKTVLTRDVRELKQKVVEADRIVDKLKKELRKWRLQQESVEAPVSDNSEEKAKDFKPVASTVEKKFSAAHPRLRNDQSEKVSASKPEIKKPALPTVVRVTSSDTTAVKRQPITNPATPEPAKKQRVHLASQHTLKPIKSDQDDVVVLLPKTSARNTSKPLEPITNSPKKSSEAMSISSQRAPRAGSLSLNKLRSPESTNKSKKVVSDSQRKEIEEQCKQQ